MSSRAFDAQDLLAFASISGDRNPLHVDPAVARRTMAGEQTMHGVLGVLWTLDRALVDAPRLALSQLSTTFRRPVRVGEAMECTPVRAAAGTTAKIAVVADDRPRFDVTVSWSDALPDRELAREAPMLECRDLGIEELATRTGTTPLCVDVEALARLVPSAAGSLPAQQLAFLLATTRVIGMECPGLHSLYVSLDVRFDEGPAETLVHWRTSSVNQRHGRVQLELRSGGMSGALTAFMRPRPIDQPTFAKLATSVRAGELAAERVLIVGGSRGLGEISAKLVAAAGGDVAITYHQGRDDARRVVEEIVGAGGRARALELDVLRPDTLVASLDGWIPTALYYFASPRIDFGRAGTFSPSLFRRLSSYYVDGFAAIRIALRAMAETGLRVLYASSYAIVSTEPGAEYAAAKAAGEVVAAQLAREHGDTLHAPRFPRLRTDQTANIVNLPSAEPGPVVLEAMRALHGLSA